MLTKHNERFRIFCDKKHDVAWSTGYEVKYPLSEASFFFFFFFFFLRGEKKNRIKKRKTSTSEKKSRLTTIKKQ